MNVLRTRLVLISAVLTTHAAKAGVDTAGDFDGDGRADVGVFTAASGTWYLLGSNGSTQRTVSGWNSDRRPVLGDFDGDGKADLASQVQRSGAWYIQQSSDNGIQQFTLGGDGWRPVTGDFDGDGKTDAAIFRRDNGTWQIRQSSNASTVTVQYGTSTMRPVPGDFDGDGRTDLALYERATGNWYIRISSNGAQRVQNWGWNETRPVPADYDGDGKTDLAVYHFKTGNWYIRNSSNGSQRMQNWGWNETRPTPGDFDGDGRADLAVYHRKTATWYIRHSSSNKMITANWGTKDSAPLAAFRDGGIEGLVTLSFGDSITYGTSSSSGSPLTGYPLLLEYKNSRSLGGHFVSLNAGNPGETTSEGVQRIGSWLSLFKPDLTLIMEGTNDQHAKTPFSTTQQNLLNMVLLSQAYGSQVVIATIPPVIKSAYRDRTGQEKLIEQFNPRIYTIAAQTGIRVAPVWESITAVPNWQTLLMDQETANHPNDAGYRVVRDTFFNVIQQLEIDGKLY